MNLPGLPRRIGLPLAMQMVAILVCALLAAQFVTLALTVVLPPSPTARWNMEDVVEALKSRELPDRLERKTMDGPPDVSGQGWLVSESSREALAKQLGSPTQDVVLAFYTQLPVGGVAVPTNSHSPLAIQTSHRFNLGSLLIDTAKADSIPGGPPGGGAMGPGGGPGGGFPGGLPPGGTPPAMPGMPGGGMPRGSDGPGGIGRTGQPGGTQPGGTMPGGAAPAGAGPSPANTSPATSPATAPASVPGTGQIAPNAAAANGGTPGGEIPGGRALGGVMPGGGLPAGGLAHAMPNMTNLNAVVEQQKAQTANAAPLPDSRSTVKAISTPQLASTSVPATVQAPVASAQPTAATAKGTAQAAPIVNGTPQPIPFRRTRDSVFELTSPPFIEGDFVAAARQPNGQWIAVAPRPEPFPNAWQKRVMLWFALSLAVISPLALLFVRRIVLPLRDFAQAAEQLGRDPSATIIPLSGPAEIGRAANAFNQMRNRLRAFVDDRTAMVGAISHDLRTPLTRLRFRIEDVDDEQREGLLKEVTEMEAMISQVIAFIRDASTPGPREHIDFAELVRGSVADARLVGADVEIESNAHIPVDVDPVGIRRLLGNLLENAVKYGERARVRVSLADGEAVAEIRDAGPGIPEDEFDRAFEPFYRSESARKSGQNGSGLGLAVCRSIARAHGGDVSFAHANDGFVARVRVPASFDPTLRQAA